MAGRILHLGHDPVSLNYNKQFVSTEAGRFDPRYDNFAMAFDWDTVDGHDEFLSFGTGEFTGPAQDVNIHFRHLRSVEHAAHTNISSYSMVVVNTRSRTTGLVTPIAEILASPNNSGEVLVVRLLGPLVPATAEATFPRQMGNADNRITLKLQLGASGRSCAMYLGDMLIAVATDSVNASDLDVCSVAFNIRRSYRSPWTEGHVQKVSISEVYVTDGIDLLKRQFARLGIGGVGHVNEWDGTFASLTDNNSMTRMIASEGDKALAWNVGSGPAVVLPAEALLSAHVVHQIEGSEALDLGAYVRVGGTDYEQDILSKIPEILAPAVQSLPVNPATQLPWTLTELAGTEFGLFTIAEAPL